MSPPQASGKLKELPGEADYSRGESWQRLLDGKLPRVLRLEAYGAI